MLVVIYTPSFYHPSIPIDGDGSKTIITYLHIITMFGGNNHPLTSYFSLLRVIICTRGLSHQAVCQRVADGCRPVRLQGFFFGTTSRTLAVFCRCVMFRTSIRLRPSGCNSRKWESKRVLTHHQMSLPPCLPPLRLRRRPAASAASLHRSFRAAMRPPRKGPARAAGHLPRSPGGCRPPAFPATWWVTKWCMVK